MEAKTMVRNGRERKEYRLGDEEYNGKIKKCAISSAKANKRGATGWKIWSDWYKRGRNVNITGVPPGICITYICIEHPV